MLKQKKFDLIRLDDTRFKLTGVVDFETSANIHRQYYQLLETQQIPASIHINFAEVSRIDSSALALLIDWLRDADRRKYQLVFENLPQQLLALAKLSDVDSLLEP